MTRVAVVGGGQLARMMAPAATAMGVTLRVLAEAPDSSAALAAHETVVGLPSDPAAVAALLADPAPDVVTWEHEHIPDEVFAACEARGIPALPGRTALAHARDKIVMREAMDSLGLPNPSWQEVTSEAEVRLFLEANGQVAVLKTAMGGYDGKGVRIVRSAEDCEDWLLALSEGGPRLLIEAKVNFRRELAIQVARSAKGEIALYPVVESIQRDGVCSEVIAPAQGLDPAIGERAKQIATTIAVGLDVVGMLAVELFETSEGLVINELAMRPHNSGHWSIDGCVTSQFEQHLRAVLGWPLGATGTVAPVTVMANILGGSRTVLESAWPTLGDPGAKVHLYGKEHRVGRKLGHVTVLGDHVDEAASRAVTGAAWFKDGDKA